MLSQKLWLLSLAAMSNHKWTGKEVDPPAVDNGMESAWSAWSTWSTWAVFVVFAGLADEVKCEEGISDIVESYLEAPRTNLPVRKSVNLDYLSNAHCDPGLELTAILENWHYHSPNKPEGYLAPKNQKRNSQLEHHGHSPISSTYPP